MYSKQYSKNEPVLLAPNYAKEIKLAVDANDWCRQCFTVRR